LPITTIRVVHRTDTFVAKGTMLKGVGMSKVRASCEPKLYIVIIYAVGAKLGKAVGNIRGRAHQGADGERFRLKAEEVIKEMGRNNVGELGDHSNAVPGVNRVKEGIRIGQERGRKSRGRFRT
jgi:hypothetical protein